MSADSERTDSELADPVTPGRIVVLNGAPRSGKSSIAEPADNAKHEAAPGRIVVLNGPPPTAFRQLAEQA